MLFVVELKKYYQYVLMFEDIDQHYDGDEWLDYKLVLEKKRKEKNRLDNCQS